MQITIPVYSEQDLTPRAMEVIRAIVDSSFPEHTIKFKASIYDFNNKVLIFGKPPVGKIAGRTEFVYTYSIAQIMSKANAASVLAAGIRQFISEPDPIPFERPQGFMNVVSALSAFDPKQPTAIDIETDGNLGKTHTPEDVNIISVAFYQPGHAPAVIRNDSVDGTMLPIAMWQRTLLVDYLPKFEFGIYHNGKFDIRIMNRVFGIKLVNSFDTMLAHHVLNHAAGDHKLKSLARRYLGAPEWEADLGKYTKGGGHYELIPEEKLVEYNGWDVYWTYKLFEFLYPQIEADENNVKAFAFEMEAANFLLDVESYGIPFNRKYAEDYAAGLGAKMEFELETLRLTTDIEKFNPNSPKQVKEWLDRMGYIVPSTNAESIALARKTAEGIDDTTVVKFCDALLAYRKAAKIKGTYAEGWMSKERNGRVHATYLVHGTSTGRLSSTGPNAQNVPRDKAIRKLVKTHKEINA